MPPSDRGVAWSGDELHAFKVHGIHPDEFKASRDRSFVALDIEEMAKKHTGRQGQLPVLVSDNIHFEWAFTRRILKGIEPFRWPFHYCGWDTSLLLEATGVGDPKPAHRAFADAGLLHAAILKALAKIELSKSAG